ncbi:MAG: hypothetical protein JWQ73_3931 [Variovorax sp.]|nr:hypothetical protein [Variovorax sp.]
MLNAPTANSLYRQVLEEDFWQLHPAVQRFHSLSGTHILRGEVRMQAPRRWLAKSLARLLGAALAAVHGHIRFELGAQAQSVRWTRHFPARSMTSTLTKKDRFVLEKLGAARLTFRLEAAHGRLVMHLERLHFLGLRCPRWALPTIVAEESGETDVVHFNVSASLLWVGLVSGYRGTLLVPEELNS